MIFVVVKYVFCVHDNVFVGGCHVGAIKFFLG